MFPFTDGLRSLVQALWAEHEALKERGVICRSVFHRNGKPIKGFRGAWASACKDAGLPGRIPTTSGGQPSATWSWPACRAVWRCKLTGHKTEARHRRYAITSEADLR